MNLFSAVPADAIFLNRMSPSEILGTSSEHDFVLDELHWPSVEHYYQANKYEGKLKEKIRICSSPDKARRLGRSIFKRKRPNWQKIRSTVMTRAVYTKCKAHQDVAEALLMTENKPLANNAFGDYYWGVGRDGRGDNHYGKILQNIRERLRAEADASKASEPKERSASA